MTDEEILEFFLKEVEMSSEPLAKNLRLAVQQFQAQAAAMRGALEHSTSALEYVADELRALGENGDADMMERQAQENHAALAAGAGRELLEQLKRTERERDGALAALKAIEKIQQAVLNLQR